MTYIAVIILLIIIDIYWIIAFRRLNKKAKQEIINTRIWCNKLIDSIIEQESKTNEKLAMVLRDMNKKEEQIDNDTEEKIQGT